MHFEDHSPEGRVLSKYSFQYCNDSTKMLKAHVQLNITEWLVIKDYGNNGNTVGKCCSKQKISGTFESQVISREYGPGRCPKWHSNNPKISRRLQIFVLLGLAGKALQHASYLYSDNWVSSNICTEEGRRFCQNISAKFTIIALYLKLI